jgi:hypothetical protein
MPVPAIPSPRTWVPGIAWTEWLRADVSDAAAWLSRPSMYAGSQHTAQSIPNATVTGVNMDTDSADPYSSHLTGAWQVYPQFPGWYLTRFSAIVAFLGAGTVQCGIGYVTGGGAQAVANGTFLRTSGSLYVSGNAAKLVEITNVAGLTGDYLGGVVYQTSGSAQPLLAAGQPGSPYLAATWAAATSGTAPLPVPANPAWPVPPAYVQSAFMNANVRDAIRFLIYPPIMEATYAAGTQTLATAAALPAVGTTTQLDTVTVDNYSAFSTSTHTWTAPVAGTYWCYGATYQQAVATTESIAVGLTVNSANYGGSPVTFWSGAGITTASVINADTYERRFRLNAGDTITLAAYQQDSAAGHTTLTGTAGSNSRLITVWRSA